MTMEPDHGHGGHAHKTGVPWLDVIVALSAVFISVVSLVVSIAHGQTMERMVEQNEKMVAADTMPFLIYYPSNYDLQTKQKQISLNLKNGGVGPAVIDWVELRWRGKAYDTDDLMRACCAPPGAAGQTQGPFGVATSNASGIVLPAREVVQLLVGLDVKDPAVADALNKAKDEITLRACYCSVLNECWITDFRQSRPKPVKECTAPPGLKRW